MYAEICVCKEFIKNMHIERMVISIHLVYIPNQQRFGEKKRVRSSNTKQFTLLYK